MSIAEKITRAKADLDAVYAVGKQDGRYEGVDQGYNQGFNDGNRIGYDSGYTEGKQAEYDAFWDEYQQNGTRIDYSYCAFGRCWTDAIYKPKYPLKPRYSYQMYSYSNMTEVLNVDTSNSTNISGLFSYCAALKRVGIIDARQGGNIGSMFYNCRALQTIDKLILAADNTYTNVFINCTALENLTIEGTIGGDGFNVQYSTNLSKASHVSIMTAVSTTAATAVTFSKTAVDKAFETSAGANDGSTSPEWQALIGTRPLCTVALA